MFVDLCSICQAGPVGNGPGPNFGRKPNQIRPKLVSYYKSWSARKHGFLAAPTCPMHPPLARAQLPASTRLGTSGKKARPWTARGHIRPSGQTSSSPGQNRPKTGQKPAKHRPSPAQDWPQTCQKPKCSTPGPGQGVQHRRRIGPAGYLKAVWWDLLGRAFSRSGRPRGPGKALKNVGGFAPNMLEGLPGPPGLARPQKCTPKNPARLPSGTQSNRTRIHPKVGPFGPPGRTGVFWH
jgi:hypothetical protein